MEKKKTVSTGKLEFKQGVRRMVPAGLKVEKIGVSLEINVGRINSFEAQDDFDDIQEIIELIDQSVTQKKGCQSCRNFSGVKNNSPGNMNSNNAVISKNKEFIIRKHVRVNNKINN